MVNSSSHNKYDNENRVLVENKSKWVTLGTKILRNRNLMETLWYENLRENIARQAKFRVKRFLKPEVSTILLQSRALIQDHLSLLKRS